MELTEQQVWNLVVYGTAFMLLVVIAIIGLVLSFNSKSRKYAEELAALREKLNKEKKVVESEWLEISNGRKVKRRPPPPESRFDCPEFEMKEHGNQCGDCQTDGHFLCGNCKHIAAFEKMELSDNRERYYPKQYKEELQKVVGTMDGDKCNRDGCEYQPFLSCLWMGRRKTITDEAITA